MVDREPGTKDRILDMAEALLHRMGPAKMGVVDVARALGMSHANVYRHFSSKADLRDAVVERWLHRVSEPLAAIAAEAGPAAERLDRWLWALIHIKRRKVLDDPAMSRTYHGIASEAREAVEAHVAELRGQIAGIIADGMTAGAFHVTDPAEAAAAVLSATGPFHHPLFLMARAQGEPFDEQDAAARAMIRLLIAGLRHG